MHYRIDFIQALEQRGHYQAMQSHRAPDPATGRSNSLTGDLRPLPDEELAVKAEGLTGA